MADTPTELPPSDGAMEQALHEIDAMRASASDADALAGSDEHAVLHEVDSVGRYAVPYEAGWRALLSVIRDGELKIGLSKEDYPSFDAVVANHFEDTLLAVDVGLRENLAAIRNYLMQVYYAETPEGMTPEKARHALEEIGGFVGDGLSNYRKLAGAVPRFEIGKPMIDPAKAAADDGAGVQYLYEKIHEWQRHSGWIRPFSAIVALFGGKVPVDWMLPPLAETPFSPWFRENLDALDLKDGATPEEIEAAMRQLDALELRHLHLQEELRGAASVQDLDAIADHLILTADALNEVASMSEPVRRDAIEIAKDILRKLRALMGEIEPKQGLIIIDDEVELNALGGIRAVVEVYKRLLAWGRGIDPTILQHPSIIAATRAIGQIGYMAKVEAMRMAMASGNDAMAQQLQQDLNYVPSGYKDIKEKNLAAMLDRIERGIDTVLNRVQTISGPGAAVGHSPAKELGSFMSGTPIAGNALQGQAEGVGQNNAAKQQAATQDRLLAANRMQAQRVTQQLANQQQRGGHGTGTTTSSRSGTTAQLNALRQRLSQARRSSMTQMTTTAARANTIRNAWLLAHAHDEEEHHHHLHGRPPASQMGAAIAKMDPRLISNLKQMNTVTAGLTNMAPVTGKQAFDKMRQANTYGLKPSPTPPKPTDAEKKKKDELVQPPHPPKDKGGRGY